MKLPPDHPHDHAQPFIHDRDRLDQHFLDGRTAQHIVGTLRPTADDVVLEIGSGTGVLTAAILAASPRRLIAVEVDHRCEPYLSTLRRGHRDLTVIMNRIQNVPPASLDRTTMIIANPPFSVLQTIARLLHDLPDLRAAVLCVSQRWARTVTAPLGTASYGPASVIVQARFDTRLVGEIEGDRFRPPIRHSAALLRLTRRPERDPALDALAEALVHRGGLRVKDFLRSNGFRRTMVGSHDRALLASPALQALQQRRLTTLTNRQITELATAFQTCRKASRVTDHPDRSRSA